MEVFILSHGYDYGDIFDKYKWNEESRVLGAYYTKREALKALSKYQKIKKELIIGDFIIHMMGSRAVNLKMLPTR